MADPSDIIDRDNFAPFYVATEGRIRAYALRSVYDHSLADDLVQEAYVKLLTSRGAQLPDSERTLYLFKIMTNLIRNHRASSARQEAWSDDHGIRMGAAGAASGRELTLDLKRALAKVNGRYRALLWLAYVEEFTHEEIAAIVGVNRLSVKVMLHRARKILAELLEKQR